MVEGLWSVEFASSQGFVGAGVAVFETQRIFGGDSFYFYVGDYRVNNDKIAAKVTVTHYNGPTSSIFGSRRQFEVVLFGEPQSSIMIVEGNLVDDPTQKIIAKLTKRADLP